MSDLEMRVIRNNMFFEELVGEDWVTEGYRLEV